MPIQIGTVIGDVIGPTQMGLYEITGSGRCVTPRGLHTYLKSFNPYYNAYGQQDSSSTKLSQFSGTLKGVTPHREASDKDEYSDCRAGGNARS